MKYFQYRLKAGSGRGYGIHSPLIYDFSRKVLHNEDRLRVPENVNSLRRSMLSDRNWMREGDPGAGSRVAGSKPRRISHFARQASVGRRYGSLLFRMVHWFQPEGILELGTGIGMSSLYLSSGFGGRFISIEGDHERCRYARKIFSEAGIPGYELHCSKFEEKIDQVSDILKKRCLVFIDGDHRYEAVTKLVNRILDQKGKGELCIVLDDIHWSSDMEKAWKHCITDSRCSFSIDVFRLGVLFARENPVKQHFTLFF